MKKFYQLYKGVCPRIEVITIEGDKFTQEFLFSDNKAVWKTWKMNIIDELKWKSIEDFIKHLKKSYKELKEYKDDLIWINPNTGEEFKQYKFEVK